MKVVTVLPRREGYAPNRAGAIGLLVSRLASPEDVILGSEITDDPLPGGRFIGMSKPGGIHSWRRLAHDTAWRASVRFAGRNQTSSKYIIARLWHGH